MLQSFSRAQVGKRAVSQLFTWVCVSPREEERNILVKWEHTQEVLEDVLEAGEAAHTVGKG